jgi:hypothetical protein
MPRLVGIKLRKGATMGKYDDIINLPNPTPTCRPRMSALDRAAQFAPFAALTGYEAVVAEAARLTDDRLELSEDMKIILNDKMQMIVDNLDKEPFVTIRYFVPDKRKAGGAYVETSGIVKEIDEYERCIIMTDGIKIPIEQIRAIDGELLNCFE